MSAPKGVTKGLFKRKNEGKDNRLLKKGLALPASDNQRSRHLPSLATEQARV